MEQYFASLTKRQTMLLLTTLTFSGGDSVDVFEHLPEEDSALLKHRAELLGQIPRDKRVPFLVQEIKRLVTARRRQLASADPARLAEVLGKERPAVIETVLRALPAQLALQVRAALPEMPEAKLNKEVKPEILALVRWKLEEELKRSTPKVGTFKFTDLLILQSRELLTIVDRMGARALATAFAGMLDGDREDLFKRLPPDQRSLAERACEAGKGRKLSGDDSKTVLEMHGALKDPSAGLRSAGVQRIARACAAQGPEFAARLIERHNDELGRLLQRWVREERHKPVKGDGGRTDIVEQMERLAVRGVIDRPMRLPPPPRVPPSSRLSPPRALELNPRRDSAVLQPLPIRRESGVLVPPPRGPAAQPPQADERTENPNPQRDAKPRSGERSADRGDRGNERLGERPTERPAGVPTAGGPGRRRDMIAEREARKAGAASNRPASYDDRRVGRDVRSGVGRAVKAGTDPGAKAVRIVREGKPLQIPSKARTSPALQEIPRRRNAPREGTHVARSPVLKSRGRGPDDGSR